MSLWLTLLKICTLYSKHYRIFSNLFQDGAFQHHLVYSGSLKSDFGHWLTGHSPVRLFDVFAFMYQLTPHPHPLPPPPHCQRLSTILWVKRWVWVDASAHPAAATVTTVFIKEEGSVPAAWLVTSVWLYCGQPQLIALYCSLKVLYCKSTHSTGRGFDVRI